MLFKSVKSVYAPETFCFANHFTINFISHSLLQRNWYEYKRGFGSPGYNLWLGLDNLHALTTQRQYTLRIDLYDWDNLRRTAIYRNFYVAVSNHCNQ